MSEYTYQVMRTADGKYRATCAEFPSLSHAADDETAALAGIKRLVMFEIERIAARDFWQQQTDAGRFFAEEDHQLQQRHQQRQQRQ
jgi:predicted RNase H-like HicB family nuclease